MSKDKCPCICKPDADDIKLALTTARDVYRHIIKTLAIDMASPEYVVLEERADKFDNLTYQLDKITCTEEDTKRTDKTTEKMKHMTFEQISKLPLKERIKIATGIASTVSCQ